MFMSSCTFECAQSLKMYILGFIVGSPRLPSKQFYTLGGKYIDDYRTILIAQIRTTTEAKFGGC